MEPDGSPRFLENPDCTFALLSDPGATQHKRPYACFGAAPAPETTKARATSHLSRLNDTASALAVYASQSRIAPDPRKTRFRLLARLCRAGLNPQGSNERFLLCFLT